MMCVAYCTAFLCFFAGCLGVFAIASLYGARKLLHIGSRAAEYEGDLPLALRKKHVVGPISTEEAVARRNRARALIDRAHTYACTLFLLCDTFLPFSSLRVRMRQHPLQIRI